MVINKNELATVNESVVRTLQLNVGEIKRTDSGSSWVSEKKKKKFTHVTIT